MTRSLPFSATGPRPPVDPPADAEPAVRLPDAPEGGSRMVRHTDQCIICGQANAAGLRLRIYADEGVATFADMDVTPARQGQAGRAHGGLLALAFDEVMGAVNWLTGPATLTGRLDVVFLAPVPVGSHLHFRARSAGVHRRKNYVAGECRVGGGDGQLVATASAVFVRPR